MNTNGDNSNSFNIDRLPYSYAKKNKISYSSEAATKIREANKD